ncbi:C40 family peptidase [Bilophila wadsworthia]|uniref:C40 family peptidase n=1 Tax=Bilophila wadsworthia TaxID=35833 RepID=UPI001E1AB8C9|nr:NlpC/P60 family protein [Bilophila wadsworthia]MBS5376249.1 C40 family peptidase [Bilophila wadsworthia]
MKARHSSICTVALLVAAIALSGCSSKKLQPAFEPVYDDPYSFEAYLENRKKADRSSMSQEERFAYDNRTASLSTMRESGIPLPNLHLIEQAKTALGTPYVPGGTDTQGFDCSGFVQWAYRNVGVTLPRTAREQSVMGRPIKSGSMMAGDIVAFNHPRRGYHTGIYLGGGSFIHSPGRGKSVSIAALSDPYFSSTFIGARRVQSKESDAEAIKKLMALDSRKPTRTHKAALASSQKRSATRKQTPAAVAEHRTQADTHRKASAPAAKQEPAQNKKNGGPAVAARKQTTPSQATAKAATKTIPPKKEAPGKQAAQAPNTKKGAVPAKNTPVSEPAKAKAAPAKAGKEGKAAQPATNPQTAAQNGQPAKPTSNTQKPAPNKAAQPVAGKKAVPAKADGKTTATAKAPVKTKAEQPKAATQTAKTTATAPAKAAQTQKPAQNSKASAKAPTNSAPVKARATQAKPEKAAPKQPAKTAQQKSGK